MGKSTPKPILNGAGNNLVVGYVMKTAEQRRQLASLLSPFDVFYVGVHCSLPELERRERQRGDRRAGDARQDHETVHTFGAYDAEEVDATLPPERNAALLAAAWKARRRPGVFGAWTT